jgi:hypothetical protein
MRIDSTRLEEVILEVGAERFDRRPFSRRQLMDAAEQRLRELGYWESIDEELSGSRGLKSRGAAMIDWRITDMKHKGSLLNPSRDVWKLP